MRESRIKRALGHALCDRYRLDELIAVGGLGAVFAATDLAEQKACAVKLLGDRHSKHVIARFQREQENALRLAALDAGEHLVQYFTADTDYSLGAFLVMELLPGPSLDQLIGCPWASRSEFIVSILAQVAQALAALHARAIVHRDVKPSNVVLSCVARQPRVKLIDIGLAHLLGDPRLTTTQPQFGTLIYMAPEVLKDSTLLNPALDLYSLGILAYHLFLGSPPFPADAEAIIDAKQHPLKPLHAYLPQVPQALADLVSWLVYPDPRCRPAAAEVAAFLSRSAPVWNGGAAATPLSEVPTAPMR